METYPLRQQLTWSRHVYGSHSVERRKTYSDCNGDIVLRLRTKRLLPFFLGYLLVIVVLSLNISPVYASPTAPVLASFSSNEGNAVTTIAVDKPTGTSSGDLLIVFCSIDGTGAAITGPSGFTVLLAEYQGNGITAASWYRGADGTEGASFSCSWSGTEDVVIGCFRITGWDSTDFPHKSATNTGTGQTVFPAVTTTKDDCLLLRFFGMDDDDDTEPIAGCPSGHTEMYALATTSSWGEHTGASCWRTWTSAGDTGTATWAHTSGEGWYSATIAIAPTAVGEYERTSSFTVTIGESVSTLEEYLRGIAYSIDVAFSFSRIGEFLRSVTYNINVALNMIGVALYERSASFAITLALVTSKLGEFKREPTYSINVAQSTTTLGEFLRSAGYTVTVSYSALGLGSYSRTSSYPITVSLSSTGVPSYERTSSFTLTISYGASKIAEFLRTSSYSIDLSLSTSKLGEFLRTVGYSVSVALSSSALGQYLRSSSYTVTVDYSTIRIASFQRLASYTVTISHQTSKLCEFSRSSTYSITVSYAVAKLCGFIRGASYTINVALSSIGEKVGVYERSVTYQVTLSLGGTKLGEFLRGISYTVNVVLSSIGQKLTPPSEGGRAGSIKYHLLVHVIGQAQRPKVTVYNTDGTVVDEAYVGEDGKIKFHLETGIYRVVAELGEYQLYSEWLHLNRDSVVILTFSKWVILKIWILENVKVIVALILLGATGAWLWKQKGRKKPSYIPKLP